VGRSRHLVDGDCKERDNRHGLDCHRVHLEEQHHPAGLAGIAAVAARIRTADAAVVDLGDCQEAAVEVEGSCTAGCQPSGDAAGSVGCREGDSGSDYRSADEIICL
jgi:hypothetical protein